MTAEREPKSDLTAGAFYESVTGEERGLIKRVFKEPLARMSKDDQETFIEALVFLDLHRRREPDAAGRAHSLTVGELQSYFSDDEQDEDEEAVAAGEA